MKNLEKVKKQKATRIANAAIKSGMDIASYELKIDSSHLSKQTREKISLVFLSAKWLRNYMISSDTIFSTPDSIKEVPIMCYNPATGKCDKQEIRKLAMSSQIKQSYIDLVQQSIKSLSAAKKAGRSVGKLKFSKEIRVVPLNQPNVTYRLIGHNKVRLQGIGIVKVHGLEQIRGKILANAQFVKRASGLFIKVICYRAKNTDEKTGEIGIDMGIKDTLVFSDGRKVNVKVKAPRRLKRLQKNLSRKKRGSRRYVKNQNSLRKAYERLSDRKNDIANKLVNNLKGYSLVAIQDENLSGWQAGHFGKTLSESVLGRIKTKIKRLETSVVIDRFLPTTKFSPVSFKNLEIKLSDRTFADGEYKEDRDVKAAKTILCFAAYKPDLTRKELMGLSVEELTTMFGKFHFPTQVSPVKRKATSGEAATCKSQDLLEATSL